MWILPPPLVYSLHSCEMLKTMDDPLSCWQEANIILLEQHVVTGLKVYSVHEHVQLL